MDTDSYSMDIYNHELSNEELFGPLTAQEEKEIIANLCSENDDIRNKARSELISHHLRFAVWMVNRYLDKGVSFEDLVNEANMGLCIAADKFSKDHGVRFQTYAKWWIRDSIEKAIESNARGRNGKSSETNMERTVSLNAPLIDNESGSLLDMIPDPDDGETQVFSSIRDQRIREAINDLCPFDRDLLTRKYGIGRPVEQPCEIAKSYGISVKNLKKAQIRAEERLKLRLKGLKED